MLVQFQDNISFKAISLNKDETKQVTDLLPSVANPLKKEQATLELFDIFDKHLQSEAKAKSRGIYKQEDFLQRLYLTLLESLENVKPLTVNKLLNILNNTKPNKDEIEENYRRGIISIDEKLGYSDDRTIESKLTEDNLPKPISTTSSEERAMQQKNIQELSQILQEKEQNLLFRRSQGKTYKEIASEFGVCSTGIYYRIKSIIAKIQLNQGVLPKEYSLFADNFIKTFNINLSREEALNFVIDNVKLINNDINTLAANIGNTSKLLEINRKLFTKAALRQPQLFSQKPETIFNNIDSTSKLLEINRKLFTQAALRQPQLFSQKPETIFKNIDNASKLFEINRKLFTQAALREPSLFYQKPETIFSNIDSSSKLLEINRKLFTQAALKQPSLFIQKPETIFNNIDSTSKLFEINRKLFTQAALREPSLFYQNPETIFNNIYGTSKLLGVDRKLLLQTALKQPSLFIQKPETIFNNIDSTSKLLGIDCNLLVQAALREPSLFYQKPETIFNNIDNTSKLFEKDRKLFTQAALKHPSLLIQKPETIFNNIGNTSKLLEINRKLFTQAALKHPSLFSQKPETIFNNIDNTSKLLGVDRNLLVQMALKQPQLFCQKPKTLAKKNSIIKYYKQLQGKNNEKLVIPNNSEQKLYYNILSYLVKAHDKLPKALKESELVEYLKAQNKIYNFTIPKNELAEEFIIYAQDFLKTNSCKKIFNIIIK